MGKIIWYAALRDKEDTDWGYGSHNIEEAKQMCLNFESSDAYIAVIDDTNDDPICINEIYQKDF